MGTDLQSSFERLDHLFECSSSFLPSDSDIANLPISMPSTVICLKVTYLQFYLDYLLFVQGRGSVAMSAHSSRLKIKLLSVLDRICKLISHLLNILDVFYESYEQARRELRADLQDTPAKDFPRFNNVGLLGMKSSNDPKISDGAFALLYCSSRMLLKMLHRL